MQEQFDQLEREFHELETRLGDSQLMADRERYTEAVRRYRQLERIVELIRTARSLEDDLSTARELAAELDGDDRAFALDEAETARTELTRVEEQLRVEMIPRDPNDDRNVIIEIRGAEGGEEANIFARDLFRMYQGFATRRGWRLDVLEGHDSPMGGYTDVIFRLTGEGIWTQLKHEAGPHRVQRVPVTESQGRTHTSSATVTVLAEAEEVDIEIDPNDLQVDVYRSSGPGGQSVNTTDSAVRITHRPTGVTVSMQDEKSQIQNRAKALTVLRSRLLQLEQERQAAETSAARRSQIGGGGRSEKIRTYNFRENRVTDHRIGLTVYKLDRILAGELEDVVDPLVHDERSRQLAGEL